MIVGVGAAVVSPKQMDKDKNGVITMDEIKEGGKIMRNLNLDQIF